MHAGTEGPAHPYEFGPHEHHESKRTQAQEVAPELAKPGKDKSPSATARRSHAKSSSSAANQAVSAGM